MENPQKYLTLPEGFDFPQKPRPLITESRRSRHDVDVGRSKNDVEMRRSRDDVERSRNDVDMDEEKEVKNVSKFNQNGLTLSNLSLSSSKNDIFKAMLSYEAREHVEKMFAGQYDCKRNTDYVRAENAHDAAFSFFCGDILNFAELEMVIAEIHNWIALSPKLPKMSLLGEMHYISKVVLPELCIFALGRINQVSPKDAEILYNKAVKEKKSPSSACQSRRTKTVDPTNHVSVSKAENSFEQLLRAVSIERSK
jgi:hypothetical protein